MPAAGVTVTAAMRAPRGGSTCSEALRMSMAMVQEGTACTTAKPAAASAASLSRTEGASSSRYVKLASSAGWSARLVGGTHGGPRACRHSSSAHALARLVSSYVAVAPLASCISR